MTEKQGCAKCGSDRVLEDVRVVDGTLDEDLVAKVEREPHARRHEGAVSVPLKARVCGSCGFAELYASDPAILFRAEADSMVGQQ